MKKVKTGETVKLKKEHNEFISEIFKRAQSMEFEIDNMSTRIFDYRKKAWEFIYEIYPELKDYNLTHLKDKGEILIVEKKEDKKWKKQI